MQLSDVRAVVGDLVDAVRETAAALKDVQTRLDEAVGVHEKRKAALASALRQAAAEVRKILRAN